MLIVYGTLKEKQTLINWNGYRATKLIPELSNKSYSNRLKSLNLPALKYRRHRGDDRIIQNN